MTTTRNTTASPGVIQPFGDPVLSEQVRQDSGCINHIGGEITYCLVHAAAPSLLAVARSVAGFMRGRCEQLARVTNRTEYEQSEYEHYTLLLHAIATAEGKEA